jgi:O-antigen/teichoic acid export membrane protein
VSKGKEGSFGQNALLSVAAWVVSGVAAFICVPIQVRGLGPEAYGLITLVSALVGYLGLIDLGLYQALVRYLSFYRARDEGRPVFAILRRAIVWFACAGSVAALGLILSASWLATDLLHVSPELLPSAVTVIQISAVNLVPGLLLSVGAAVPVSFLRYDIAAGMTGVFTTLSWVGPAVIVVLGYGVVGIALFYLTSNVVALVLYIYFGQKLLRPIPRDAGPEWPEIRRKVLSFAGLVAANRVGATVAAQTSRLMVGATAGTAAAAYYQVPNVLASKATELLRRIASVLFPTGAALISRGDYEGLRSLYLSSSRILFLLNAAMTVPIAIYAYPLLEYWVSPDYATEGSVALVIFCATVAINAAALSVGFLSWSAERAGTNLLYSTANSAISLALLYPLTARYGVLGAAVSGLAGALVQPFFIHHVNRRVLGVKSWVVLRNCYLPSAAGSTVVAIFSVFVLVPLADSLAATIALLMLTAVLSVVVSSALGAVTRQERQRMAKRVAKIRLRFGS